MVMAAIELDTCTACGNVFRGASKPRWVFDREGRPAGRTHASCFLSRGHHYLGGPITQETAQFDLWALELSQPRPDRASDRYRAQFLIHMIDGWISEELSPKQVERMRWWTLDGPLQLGADREPGIRAAYAELVREFNAWRDQLDAPSAARGPEGSES